MRKRFSHGHARAYSRASTWLSSGIPTRTRRPEQGNISLNVIRHVSDSAPAGALVSVSARPRKKHVGHRGKRTRSQCRVVRILGLQARHGKASFDACCRASPLASLDSRLVEMEGVSVLETLGDIPYPWIASLVHPEGNATRFSPGQFNMAR